MRPDVSRARGYAKLCAISVICMVKFLFGPINSRRFGRSLGIDLLPAKICSFDCLYCECGWTTQKTLDRSELVPTVEVLAEIDEYLSARPDIDVVTFAGNGEPTLHTGIGRIIAHIKSKHGGRKVCVLTNGTLLGEAAVQKELALADIVVPSLDGATRRSFRKICRPVHGLKVEAVIDGIASFRRGFSGHLLLEIFVVPGFNDSDDELDALKEAAEFIGPDAIQLNCLDRPAPFSRLRAATHDELLRICRHLAPLPVEMVPGREARNHPEADDPVLVRDFLECLKSGPTTLNRISLATRMRETDIAEMIGRLSGQGLDVELKGSVVRLISASRPAPTRNLDL